MGWPTPKTVVWRLSDGKPGHDNQSRGLVLALQQFRPLEEHVVAVTSRWLGVWDWICGRFSAGEGLPAPQLIVSAGHSTHPAALAARRAYGGRIVVLMQPSLPLWFFDLCFIPRHDLRQQVRIDRAHDNVIATHGALNNVRPSIARDGQRGLMLIGGPSRHHDWNDEAVLGQIHHVVSHDFTLHWTLTTSRRTPDSFLPKLHASRIENLEIVPCDQTPPGWISAQMAMVSSVFVTEDSVSMIYESLSAGADVGLLPLPRRRLSRVIRGVDRLIEDRWVIPFDEWLRTGFERRTGVVLQEADRCAEIIHRKLLKSA